MTIILGLLLMYFVSVVIRLTVRMAYQLQRQKKIACEIYAAGFWKAEGVSAHVANELWLKFRDEFRIPPGTATNLGVGDVRP